MNVPLQPPPSAETVPFYVTSARKRKEDLFVVGWLFCLICVMLIFWIGSSFGGLKGKLFFTLALWRGFHGETPKVKHVLTPWWIFFSLFLWIILPSPTGYTKDDNELVEHRILIEQQVVMVMVTSTYVSREKDTAMHYYHEILSV